MTNVVVGSLIAFSAPLLLIPVEKLLPYPYIIEELVKLVIVRMIGMGKGWWIVAAGFLFAFSESIFYLANMFTVGNLYLFLPRLFLTGSMHTVTMILMYVTGRKNAVLAGIGIIGAIFIHYLYNLSVASFTGS